MQNPIAPENAQIGAMAHAMLAAQSTAQRSAENAEYCHTFDAAVRADEAGVEASFQTISALGHVLLAEFAQAEMDRSLTEQRWLTDLRQYKGKYEPDEEAKIGANRSKAFVRKTRVKVKTVDSRVFDMLFPANADRNWTLEATPVPSVAPEVEQQLRAQLKQALGGQEPDEKEMRQAIKTLVDNSAKAMSDAIDDQLIESKYKKAAKQVMHSGHLYGTGILKAPLIERKVRTRFVQEAGKWVMKTESYVVPFVDFVPLWRFFPDMSATDLEDCRYVYERHVMSKAATLALAERKNFDSRKIRDYVTTNPDGAQTRKSIDDDVRTIGDRVSTGLKDSQYEILERWGWVDAAQLANCGVTVPEHRMHETFFANIWLLPDGEIIRAALQPINGVTWPYHLYYFDKDETSIFGEGLAAIMRDDQKMINAGTRMILDNAALTAGPQLEVNMGLLSTSEKADDMYPFKIWARNGKEPASPAIRVLNIPGKLEELYPIVSMFETNADEVTAIPRFMSGENPTQGAAGTASGLSMLMGSSNIVMKDLVGGYDIGITTPFIEALYRWNMQFNKNNDVKGDFNIKASGTASLVAKEIRSQQLDIFAQATANPLDAPFIKRENLLRQRAEAHDLVNVVKTEEEVQDEQNNDMAKQQQQLAQQQQELAMKMQAATLAKLTAEVEKVLADTRRINAEAVAKNVGAVYAATQASGVASTNPEITAGADEILKSSGFIDPNGVIQSGQLQAPAGTVQPNPEQAAQIPPMQGPQQGMQAGIETPEIEQ